MTTSERLNHLLQIGRDIECSQRVLRPLDPVCTIDEGLAILTDIPANGAPGERSVNQSVTIIVFR